MLTTTKSRNLCALIITISNYKLSKQCHIFKRANELLILQMKRQKKITSGFRSHLFQRWNKFCWLVNILVSHLIQPGTKSVSIETLNKKPFVECILLRKKSYSFPQSKIWKYHWVYYAFNCWYKWRLIYSCTTIECKCVVMFGWCLFLLKFFFGQYMVFF